MSWESWEGMELPRTWGDLKQTEESEISGQMHWHKRKSREWKLGWGARGSVFNAGDKTGEEKEVSSAAKISTYMVN